MEPEAALLRNRRETDGVEKKKKPQPIVTKSKCVLKPRQIVCLEGGGVVNFDVDKGRSSKPTPRQRVTFSTTALVTPKGPKRGDFQSSCRKQMGGRSDRDEYFY
jgi:hypothetical protein